ncbi:MAG: pyridoxamine 5'-phosphate oxidase family protein [Limisphaerales bacterium]
MGKVFDSITPELREWLRKQRLFFVGTAPRSERAHLNCSPKGGDSFRVINDHEVAYRDLTGSGIETISHLQENGRIVIMFCAFSGPPKIVRLHGQGEVLYPGTQKFTALNQHFPEHRGTRAIIWVNVTRISESCGFAVPQFEFIADRDTLDKWVEKKETAELAAYREKKNKTSIDGLPGYKT